MRRTLLAGCWLLIALSGCISAGLQPPRLAAEVWQLERTESLPELALRGYGTLAAEFAEGQLAGGRASWLLIRAESPAKARLVHAKYQSDLEVWNDGQVRGGWLAVGERRYPVCEAGGQGCLLVARSGASVLVLAGETGGSLDALAAAMHWPQDTEFAIDEPVPMYLDAWDRHGWRFYYRPWETPKDVKWADYPVLGEFDFARDQGGLGLVFWANADQADFAAGLDNSPWWSWAQRAAERRRLPVVLNTMTSSPAWLHNRFPEQRAEAMPQYGGSYHTAVPESYHGGPRLSWCSTTAKEEDLALLADLVRRQTAYEGILDVLEPHGELAHGDYDLFTEYGPVADRSYRDYLRRTHGSLAAVSRRWFGEPGRLASWDDVRVPELAEFFGFDAEALDLRGPWRIAYDRPDAPLGEDAALPGGDDSAWPEVIAPGHDSARFRPAQPAVFRRHFAVDAAWRARHPRVWLYVWDLNVEWGKPVRATLNGELAGESRIAHPRPHWEAWEVSDALLPGENLLALELPQGFLGYRVYLSPHAPVQYPALGPTLNARWVDFADWWGWARVEMARRGMEAIRSGTPDRGIVCMAPNRFITGIRELCVDYGGRFHNTGYMGAFWAQDLPMLMRGADLPFTLEPGGPAADLPTFERMLGFYLTEGVNAVHYFIHLGNVYWPAEIRAWFEAHQPLIHSFGKHRVPKAEAAILLDDRVDRLTGFPWGADPNTNLPSGYWRWRFADGLVADYHLDAVTPTDFASGLADPYRVILDTNTSVMDPALVDRIEAWVRRGGTFVTHVQTGRHTPEEPDTWPIARLTGYRVTHVNRHGAPDSEEIETCPVRFAPGQPIFDAAAWQPREFGLSNGLKLERVAPECRDLMLWDDGSVAAGLRPLGRGYVIHLGVKFARQKSWHGNPEATWKLLREILAWRGLAQVPGRLTAPWDEVLLRHSVSNNGLYDVWTIGNSTDRARQTGLRFAGSPTACRDLEWAALPPLVTADGTTSLEGIELAPRQTRILLTPRARLTEAPLEWLRLQRNWWRGTTRPERPLPAPAYPYTLDLTNDWVCQALPPDTPLASGWEPLPPGDHARRPLTVWTVPDELPSARARFRRSFTVPAAWEDGTIQLWHRAFFSQTSLGEARAWLDGQLLEVPGGVARGLEGVPVELAPGSTHELGFNIAGQGQAAGPRGRTWLTFTPRPDEIFPLAGDWEVSTDFLSYRATAALPGPWLSWQAARRTIDLPAEYAGRLIYLRLEGDWGFTGIIVNGRYLRRHHHHLGPVTLLNLTPLLHPGGPNELIIPGPAQRKTLSAVQLELHDAR